MSLISSINCTAFPTECEISRKRAVISLGMVGISSALGSILIIFTMFYFWLYRNIRHRLVLYLFFSDICQSLGSIFSLLWFHAPPEVGMISCVLQGWIFTFADAAAPLWSASLALFVALTIRMPPYLTPGRKYEIISQLIWIISATFASAGYLIATPSKYMVPVSGGVWCWIAPKFIAERLAFQYVWIFIVLILLFIIYITVGFYLCQKSKKGNSDSRNVIFKLAGFPIIFFIVFSPLTAVRVLNGLGINLPLEMAYVAICFLASDGFLNALLYGYTRRIFMRLWVKFKSEREKKQVNTPLLEGGSTMNI